MSLLPRDSYLPASASGGDVADRYNDKLAGPDSAYTKLRADYDNMTQSQQRAFAKQAPEQLGDMLPNMAISYLKYEKQRLDTNNDGVISKNEVADAAARGGIDAVFGNVLLSNVAAPGDNSSLFDQVAHTKKNWSQDPDAIETADLRKWTRQERRAERHEYNQEEVRQAAAPLFANNGALLKALDNNANGMSNGFISRHEMLRFLDDYKRHPGEGVYTRENAEYVKELVYGNIGRISNHPFHGFSVGRLSHRAGMSVAQMEDAASGAPPEGGAISGDKDDSGNLVSDSSKKSGKADSPRQDQGDGEPLAFDPRVEARLGHYIDDLCRVQPGQGYAAVAARLLNIPEGSHTSEQVNDVRLLVKQIQRLNGDIDTHKLRTGVVLPVTANLDILMTENPKVAEAVEQMRKRFQF